MSDHFYVYVLFDWLGIPRYVGKGNGRRWLRHEQSTDPINWMKNEFIERTWLMLGEIPKIKVQEELTETEAWSAEVALIAAIGRVDLGTGPLLNLSDGGAGGWSHLTLEHRQLRARRLVENMTSEERQRRGRVLRSGWTADTLRKRSESMKATLATMDPEEVREKARERGKKGAAVAATRQRKTPYSESLKKGRDTQRSRYTKEQIQERHKKIAEKAWITRRERYTEEQIKEQFRIISTKTQETKRAKRNIISDN